MLKVTNFKNFNIRIIMLHKFQQIVKNRDTKIIHIRCYCIDPCIKSHIKSENRFIGNLLDGDSYKSSSANSCSLGQFLDDGIEGCGKHNN